MESIGIADIKISISDGSGWDDYVYGHPKASFYHLYGWGRAFEDVFGFNGYYLKAEKEGKICGILPLVMQKNIFCRSLVSIPIGVYAGPLCDSNEIAKALVVRAVELTKQLGCAYLELRGLERSDEKLVPKELYAMFKSELPARSEECLEKTPRKARAAMRHAIDSGLSSDVSLKYLDDCYDIYAINQRHLGSPVVSKRWFAKLPEVFKGKTNILAVKSGNRTIAAVLTFFFKDTVMPFYGGCRPEFFRSNPNDYMYLKLQEYGVDKGFKYFDFGRSRADSGSYHFKINMGFVPTKLYYEYYLNTVKNMPNVNPSNSSFRLAQVLWKRLPISITKWIGPAIFKFVIP